MPCASSHFRRGVGVSKRSAAAAAALLALNCAAAPRVKAEIAPDQVRTVRASIANRIEALTILGGDFGFSGATLSLSGALLPGERADERLSGTKFGGAGDIGDPEPLGTGRIAWQGRLQGDLGHLDWTDDLHSAPLVGDRSRFSANAIEFGGGARFWLGERLSIAPTFMGVFGHVTNVYQPRSQFARANFDELRQLGLVDWHVNVWSIRPAVNIQYLIDWNRTIVTFSSDLTYFRTREFAASSRQVVAGGNSGFVTSSVDLNVPLGVRIGAHELRTGGYLSRTDLMGDLRQGLGVPRLNEIHGRVVADCLGQLWEFEWIGMGASYIWGPDIHGWAAGVDVRFRF